MAKKQKTAKGRKPAGTKKADRLPKQIGGVKIPKDLRKQGDRLMALLKHPLVAEMAAAGLMAFAREMRAGKAGAGKGGQSGNGAPADEARAARKSAGKALGDIARVAAILGTVLATTTNSGDDGKTRH